MNALDAILTYRSLENMRECLHSLFQGTCTYAEEWGTFFKKNDFHRTAHSASLFQTFSAKSAEQIYILFLESLGTLLNYRVPNCALSFNFTAYF